jgi:hypothetical protein
MAATNAPMAYRFLAESILRDAADQGTYFGDRKVFLGTIPGIDLAAAECVAMLDDLRRAGLLTFARADLVAAMDAELVAASEWRVDITTYHFLVVEPRDLQLAA